MSTEAKTKEKVNLDPKYIIKLTVTLFATCLVVAFCLGLVNGVTLPNITASNLAKTNAALAAVYPEIDEAGFDAPDAGKLPHPLNDIAQGKAGADGLVSYVEWNAPA